MVGGTTYVKQNGGILAFSGVAADVIAWQERGAGILAAVGSGPKSVAGGVTYTKQNAGQLGLSGVAADVIAWAETGAGILNAVGSGSKTISGGATYVKQNAGIAAFSGTAADELVWPEDGRGVRGQVGSGTASKAGIGEKSGSAIRGHAASAPDADVLIEIGSALLSRIGSGDASDILAETGSAVRGQVGSGAKETVLGARYDKLGTGIRVSTGGGVRQRFVLRSGQGTLERSGIASDVISWNERGLATLTLSASGERKYGTVPGAVTVSDHIGVSVEVTQGNGAAVGVTHRRKALVSGP